MTTAAEVFVQQLARASKRSLSFLLSRNLTRADSDDVIADALAWCWENRANYSLTTTLETWFMNAVRHSYAAWLRSETRNASEALAEIPTNDTTEQTAEALSSAHVLARALPAESRRIVRLEMEGWSRKEMMALGHTERAISEARARIKQLRKLIPDSQEYQKVIRAPARGSEDESPQPQIDKEIEQLEFPPQWGADCPPCWKCMWYEGWLPPGHRAVRMRIVEPDVRESIERTEAEKIRIANEVRGVVMGVFEYACSHCNHVTEKFVPLSERKPVVDCDSCGAPAQLQVSAVATTFRAQDRKAFKKQGH